MMSRESNRKLPRRSTIALLLLLPVLFFTCRLAIRVLRGQVPPANTVSSAPLFNSSSASLGTRAGPPIGNEGQRALALPPSPFGSSDALTASPLSNSSAASSERPLARHRDSRAETETGGQVQADASATDSALDLESSGSLDSSGNLESSKLHTLLVAGRAPAQDDAPKASNDVLATKAGSVAVCLAGGLRMFELTAFSLARNVFSAYSTTDVFVHAPVDETSHKLLLLHKLLLAEGKGAGAGARWAVKGVRLLAQEPLNEANAGARLLRSFGSPNGVQGLLQYFQLVEGCLDLVKEAEESQGFKYDWVVRTRPDGFWMGPLPPLTTLSPSAFSHPEGSSWGGINDRFAAAKREVALSALERLRILQRLTKHKGKWPREGLNSETCLLHHLQEKGIPAVALLLPFCTLSLRAYGWPITPWGLPVFSLSTRAPVNGAKCRPCRPALSGQAAFTALGVLNADKGLPFVAPAKNSVGYELCNAHGLWAEGWQEIFDSDAGAGAASLRRAYANMTEEECSSALTGMSRSLPRGIGYPAHLLCSLRPLGSVFAALATKRGALSKALAALKTAAGAARGSSPFVARESYQLERWDGKMLPAVSTNTSLVCNPCHLFVRLSARNKMMNARKLLFVMAMQKIGWHLLKCGGGHTRQICLFSSDNSGGGASGTAP